MSRKRLELDFVAPPRRPLWLGLLLLAVALAIGGDLALRLRDARQELSHIETTQSLVNTERAPIKAVPVERLDEHVKASETIVRQLTLPWATLIETLENAGTQDVAVLQVQPDALLRQLRLTAEARNQGAMWQYVNKLAAAKTLEHVHLLNHQVQLEDPQKPLQFSLQATFRGAP
jgi:hypothetical protein